MIKVAIFETIQKDTGAGRGVVGGEGGRSAAVERAYRRTPASEVSLEAPITDEVLPLRVFITVSAPSRGLFETRSMVHPSILAED